MNIQIWADRAGEHYVVEVEDGTSLVLAAFGPLHHSEVARARIDGVVNPDPELAEWMNEHEDKFGLVEPR